LYFRLLVDCISNLFFVELSLYKRITKTSSMKSKLTLKQSLKAGVFAGLLAVLVNGILYTIFHSLDVISDNIYIQPGQPMTIIPIIISSIIPSILAAFVFFLIEKYSKTGYKTFTIIAVILLLLSFLNPFMGIPNVTVGYALALNLMHITVVVALLVFIRREIRRME